MYIHINPSYPCLDRRLFQLPRLQGVASRRRHNEGGENCGGKGDGGGTWGSENAGHEVQIRSAHVGPVRASHLPL